MGKKGTKRKNPGVGIDFKRAKHKVKLAVYTTATCTPSRMEHLLLVDSGCIMMFYI
jgi:hypothetical protein